MFQTPTTVRFLLFGCVLAALSGTAMAQPTAPVEPAQDAEREWRFIQKLEDDGMEDLALRQREAFADAYPDDPRAAQALFEAAEGRAELGQTVAAQALYEKLLERFPEAPSAPRAARARAELLLDAGAFAEAADAFRSILSAYPASDEAEAARLGLAEALMAQEKNDEARGLLGSLVAGRASDDTGARALFDLALLDLRAGADSLAMRRFESIHVRYPDRPIGAFGLLRAAQVREQREEPAAARELYERVLATFREPVLRARAHLGLAALLETSDPKRAAQHYRAVAEEGGSAADVESALLGLARSALAAGDEKATIEATEAFAERFPESTRGDEAQLLRARALLASGREVEGEALLDRLATGASPEVAYEALRALAQRRSTGGAIDVALRFWERAQRTAPDDLRRAQALRARARLEREQGRPTLAADLALEAAAVAGVDSLRASALEFALQASLEGGDRERAAQIAEEIQQDLPLTPSAARARVLLLGLQRHAEGDAHAAALALAELAGQPFADPVQRALEIGRVLRDRLGDPAAALEFFERGRREAATPEQRSLAELEAARAEQLAALDAGLGGDASAAEAALRRARERLTEAAARSAAPAQAQTARLRLVALELGVAARPSAPWLFDPLRMPLLGAVGALEHFDPASPLLQTTRERLRRALEGELSAEDRAWAQWRAIEIATDAVAERRARAEAAWREGRQTPYGRALRHLLGQLLLLEGRPADAARHLAEILQADPDGSLAPAARYALAEAQRALKRWAQAGQLYADFAAAYPGTQKGQRAFLLAGDCAFFAGRADEAVQRYRALLTRYPGSAYEDDALYRLGTALERAGRLEAAREPLLRLTERAQSSDYLGRALSRLAGIEEKAGRDSAAVAVLARLVEVDPDRAGEEGAFRRLARLETERQRAEEALRWLDREAATREPDAEVLELRVRALVALGRLDEAAGALERLSLGFPEATGELSRARLELADAWLERGDVEAAAAAYATVAGESAAADDRAHALYGQGLVSIRQGKMAEAEAAFEACLRAAPKSRWAGEALFKLGQIHTRAGDHARAQKDFARLSGEHPGHPRAVDALRAEARAWRQLGRYDEAIARYHRILEQYPEIEGGEEILDDIAYCHHENGDYEMAIAIYRRVLPLLDEEAQAYAQFWIADSLAQLGRHEEAATEFLRIPYLYPESGQLPVTAQLKAGEAYEKLGRLDAAAQIYRRVIAAHGASSQWGAEATRRLQRVESSRGDQQP